MYIFRNGKPVLSKEQLVIRLIEEAEKFKGEDKETYKYMLKRAERQLDELLIAI